jgi:hypothetical protein
MEELTAARRAGMKMSNFLDKHSLEQSLRSAFPDFDNFEPDAREELRKAWTRKDWRTLTQEFGLAIDSDHTDSNSRVCDR